MRFKAGKALLSFANAFRNNTAKKPPPSRIRYNSQQSIADDETSSLEGAFSHGGEEDYQFDAFLEMRVNAF